MRFRKLLMIFLLVSLVPMLTFSQTASSVQKPVSESGDISNRTLPEETELAEAQVREADLRVSSAQATLQNWEQSGDKSDPKAFLYKQLDFKAELARAEFYAAQARAQSLKSRLQLAKDNARNGSETATASGANKKSESQINDTIVPKDITRANEEAARKGQIAVEASKKAQAAYNELRADQARKSALEAKIAEEEARKSRIRETAKNPIVKRALEIHAEGEKAKANSEAAALAKAKEQELITAETARKAELEKEADRTAKANQEAVPQQEALRQPQPVADQKIETAQPIKTETEDLKKVQARELALKVEAAKEDLQRAITNLQEAARKTQELVGAEKSIAEQDALRRAIDEMDSTELQKPAENHSPTTAEKQSPAKKPTVRRVVYSGELFTIVRDDPVDEITQADEVEAKPKGLRWQSRKPR